MEQEQKIVETEDIEEAIELILFQVPECYVYLQRQLCGELRILPMHYLNMQETMSIAILSGNITKKLDAYSLFNIDPSKVDKVYDMLMRKGLAQT